ncbi:MAG: hypothetical protein FK730_15415, partial [Asgard group archaeon]|nr:hypothetical protein [Asgard group archaeon]
MNEENHEKTGADFQTGTDIQVGKELNKSNLKRAIAIIVLLLSIFGLIYVTFWIIVAFGCIGPGAGIGFIFLDSAILFIDYLM